MGYSFVKWLNTWERKDANIEIGFCNNGMMFGKMIFDNILSIDELPQKDFFIELQSIAPPKHRSQEYRRSEIVCNFNGEIYTVIYHYNSHEYMIVDGSRTVVKWIKKSEEVNL